MLISMIPNFFKQGKESSLLFTKVEEIFIQDNYYQKFVERQERNFYKSAVNFVTIYSLIT